MSSNRFLAPIADDQLRADVCAWVESHGVDPRLVRSIEAHPDGWTIMEVLERGPDGRLATRDGELVIGWVNLAEPFPPHLVPLLELDKRAQRRAYERDRELREIPIRNEDRARRARMAAREAQWPPSRLAAMTARHRAEARVLGARYGFVPPAEIPAHIARWCEENDPTVGEAMRYARSLGASISFEITHQETTR